MGFRGVCVKCGVYHDILLEGSLLLQLCVLFCSLKMLGEWGYIHFASVLCIFSTLLAIEDILFSRLASHR